MKVFNTRDNFDVDLDWFTFNLLQHLNTHPWEESFTFSFYHDLLIFIQVLCKDSRNWRGREIGNDSFWWMESEIWRMDWNGFWKIASQNQTLSEKGKNQAISMTLRQLLFCWTIDCHYEWKISHWIKERNETLTKLIIWFFMNHDKVLEMICIDSKYLYKILCNDESNQLFLE